MAPQYLGAVWDTVVLSAATTVLTLVASYPVAYALARTPSRRVRSALLVLTLAPFFTGAIVRTYAWVLVLGNTVVTWPVPMLFTRARRARGPRALLDADHDPDARRRDQPHRSGLRAGGGQPGREPRARVLAGDAAAVHARHRLGRGSSSSPGRSAPSPRPSCWAAAGSR